MRKKLLWAISSVLTLFFMAGSAEAQDSNDLFEIPDSICAGALITPTNVISGAQSYSWSFCAPDLYGPPTGFNTGTLPSVSDPAGVILIRQGDNSFSFHVNANGKVIRSRYHNGYDQSATLIESIAQVSDAPRALYAVETPDSNYHIFILTGTDSTTTQLVRIDFGQSLLAEPTQIVTQGSFPNIVSPKQLFITEDGGNWVGFTFNKNDELVRFNFGDSLTNTPLAAIVGNIDGKFSGVSGMAALNESGNWHILVTNRTSSHLVRLSFGNSLNNVPFAIDLGDLEAHLKRPVGIALTRGCQAYYAYIVNYGTDNLVTVKWDNESIATNPVSQIQGNIAGFVSPSSMSPQIADENGSLYLFALNEDNSFSKFAYKPCTNSNIATSDLQNPPAFSYNEPGVYTVFLTINQGTPYVQTGCQDILISPHPTINLSNDTLICQGDTIELHALSHDNDSVIWAPDYNINRTSGLIADVHPDNSTNYVVTTYFGGTCIIPDTIKVTVSKAKADAGPDQVIKDGSSLVLGGAETTLGSQYTYTWTPQIGIIGSTGTPVTDARPPYDITYYLTVQNTDGCRSIDSVNIKVPCDDIHLPNAFSPSSSNPQVNHFGLLNLQLAKINYFKVFDRWGKEVFSTTDPNGQWDGTIDGKNVESGVYVWEIDAYCSNTGQRYRKSGSVTLIR